MQDCNARDRGEREQARLKSMTLGDGMDMAREHYQNHNSKIEANPNGKIQQGGANRDGEIIKQFEKIIISQKEEIDYLKKVNKMSQALLGALMRAE